MKNFWADMLFDLENSNEGCDSVVDTYSNLIHSDLDNIVHYIKSLEPKKALEIVQSMRKEL